MANTSFQLDITAAGMQVLQDMAAVIVQQSAAAILDRANSMAASLSNDPPTFGIGSRVGIIKRGERAITTVAAIDTGNMHQNYIAHQALVKAKDAGRV